MHRLAAAPRLRVPPREPTSLRPGRARPVLPGRPARLRPALDRPPFTGGGRCRSRGLDHPPATWATSSARCGPVRALHVDPLAAFPATRARSQVLCRVLRADDGARVLWDKPGELGVATDLTVSGTGRRQPAGRRRSRLLLHG